MSEPFVTLREQSSGPSAPETRRVEGPLRPFLLVPDRTEPSSTWNPVVDRLQAAGHAVLAVSAGDCDADSRADDLAVVIRDLGWTGGRAPVAVGRSWGGNVVVSLAARRATVAAVGCLDGGWSPTGDGYHPRSLLPHVAVPTLLRAGETARAEVVGAAGEMPRARVRWHQDGDPAAQGGRVPRPDRIADDLLALATDAEPSVFI